MRYAGRATAALPGAVSILLLGPSPARAHAFAARYDLPLPLDLYLAGAAAAVALSFVIMALVFRARLAPPAGDRGIDLSRLRPIGRMAIAALQTVSVALFLLVITAGFFGAQDPLHNIAPAFVWIIWWVGLAYVAALAGNPWPLLNPWSILFAWVEHLATRHRPQARFGLGLGYPPWLGAWPAVYLFGAFAWFELIADGAKVPATLAAFIVAYSALTWAGMFAFGRQTWLANGEAFALAFGIFGRFAPIGGAQDLRLRPYGAGLVVDRPCHPSMTAFVILMLSTVTFDGFKETSLWASLMQWTASVPAFHPVLLGLHDLGFDLIAALETGALALFPMLFYLVYLGFCWLTKEAADGTRSVAEIAGLFVFSLVPIAIAYHLAHYLSYLLISGQLIIPLASDPFGIGWDLFRTADRGIDIGIVGAKFVWYTAVVAIVVGHVFAVAVAHFTALKAFATAKAARASQYPFLVLMVAYTMVSLWILAQPVVASTDPTTLRAPSGTLALAPFEFQELCVEMRAEETIDYGFESDQPVSFGIHYHDGFSIRFPVQTGGVTAHAHAFTADADRLYCLMWTNPNVEGLSLTYRTGAPSAVQR